MYYLIAVKNDKSIHTETEKVFEMNSVFKIKIIK
jgi:hypothetical protein